MPTFLRVPVRPPRHMFDTTGMDETDLCHDECAPQDGQRCWVPVWGEDVPCRVCGAPVDGVANLST